MARVLIDDMTEELIRGDAEGGSVKLTLDGDSVELDLTNESQEKLRELVRPYFEAGRFIPKPGTPKSTAAAPQRSSDGGPSDQEIRQWAQVEGLEVGEYGRLPGRIREAYWRAHDGAALNGGTAQPTPDADEEAADPAGDQASDADVQDLDADPEDRPRPEQVEIAEDLLDRGVAVPTIAQQTGMSVDQVRALKRDLDAGRSPAGVST